MSKISIRFYNDREVRAIWDEEKSKWWFSAIDIAIAITDSPNPRKYWSLMKKRMKKAGNELTTCSQLKLTASDGKKYAINGFTHRITNNKH
jgi:cell filamentation protein